jgi:hypothetical protein
MRSNLTPEDLKNEHEFELLTEVSHNNLKEFILEQIREEKQIIRIYSVYQVVLMLLFAFLLTRSIVIAIKGHPEALVNVILSLLFSFTFLILIHELLHALAFWICGARKISFGYIPKKFIFYALADQQVIQSKSFHFVALTPFITVKLICIIGAIVYCNENLIYFFLSVMCLHSLFCAGDIALLAFYRLQKGKEIFNFDDRKEGKTYFYIRRKKNPEL